MSAVGGTGSASFTVSSFFIASTTAPTSSSLTTAVSGEPMPGGKCSFRTAVPRLESVGWVSPWPKPIVPWWVRLPSASTIRPEKTTKTIGRERRRTSAATRPQTLRGSKSTGCVDLEPRNWSAERSAGQKARSPSRESSAGSRVKAAASITAIPIARIGPSQWVDCRSATSSTSIAAITVPPEAAIAGTLSASAAGRALPGGRPLCSSSR